MDDPIEIVARAIRAEMDRRQGTVPDVDAYFRALARAALLALREPTEGMLDAGADRMYDAIDFSLEPGEGIDGFNTTPVWQAMIDAALGSQTQEKGNG